MIYKFIDNNGSEISVNSLESLQALVDSDTINENTKVKAGLRGKWTSASKIEGLNFIKEEEIQNTPEPVEDIKSFITQNERIQPKEEIKKEEAIKVNKDEEVAETKQVIQDISEENTEEITSDNSDYYTEKFEKHDKLENYMAPNFLDSIKICFKKYFDFKGRASRSEYWYFILFIALGYVAFFLLILIAPVLLWLMGIFFIGIIIPAISVTARRLHDINKSGWFQAIPIPPGIIEVVFAFNSIKAGEIIFLLIGIACYIYLFILYVTAGDSKQNRFGKNPLKQKK